MWPAILWTTAGSAQRDLIGRVGEEDAVWQYAEIAYRGKSVLMPPLNFVQIKSRSRRSKALKVYMLMLLP